MVLLLDADALIKLHLAGILEDIAGTFDCIIPEGIFHEVVTRGKQFHHPDAESIGKIIEAGIAVQSSPKNHLSHFGSSGSGCRRKRLAGPILHPSHKSGSHHHQR